MFYFGCQLVWALVIPLQNILILTSAPPPKKNKMGAHFIASATGR